MTQESPDRWLTRTRSIQEELQLERLQDWISRPFWTAMEAAYLLVGVTPETRYHHQQGWDFEFLPGGRRTEWLRSDEGTRSLAFTSNFESELEGTKKLTFYEGKNAIKSPEDWIKHAISWKWDPPWLSIAQLDPDCAMHLSPSEKLQERSPPVVRASPQSLGGKAKSERSPSSLVQQQIKLCLLAWHKDPRCYNSSNLFITAMYEKYQDDDAPLDLAAFEQNSEPVRVRTRKTIKRLVNSLIAIHGLPRLAK